MLSTQERLERRRRRVRAAAVVVLAAAGVAAAWLGSGRAPRRVSRAVAIGALRAMRAGHMAVWPVASVGVVVLAWRVARGRCLGCRRTKSAKVLVACGSALLGLLAIEEAAFAYRTRAHRVAVGPAILRANKPKKGATDTIKLVVLGESSARGVPYPVTIGHIVQRQLQKVFPQRRVEFKILAENGATLEQALRKLDGLTEPPDAVILYSGHNEICGRFPLARTVSHYYDELTWLDRLAEVVQSVSPLDGLIQDALDAQGKDADPRPQDRRMIDLPACTPAERQQIRTDFQARLEGLLAYCRRSGSLPILVIPPGNDGGFDPNRSVLDPTTSRAERMAVERELLNLRGSEHAAPARCIAAYRDLLARHPEFAEAHFRLARLLEQSGAYEEANPHYTSARATSTACRCAA